MEPDEGRRRGRERRRVMVKRMGMQGDSKGSAGFSQQLRFSMARNNTTLGVVCEHFQLWSGKTNK